VSRTNLARLNADGSLDIGFGVGRELHPIRMNQNSSSPLFIRSIRGGGDVSS
jgi:hypothetical protein